MSDLVLTAAQMRALERAAIDSGAVTGLELMERAGRGAVDAILAEWPDLARTSHRAVVLCGPGNNGGDGFVVARLLRDRGWDVECFLHGDAEKLPPDARTNFELWVAESPVMPISDCLPHTWLPDPGRGYPVRIDALFGIGLSRPLAAELNDLLAASLNCRTVALDLPSCLQSDTGRAMPPWNIPLPAARLTVAFGAKKPGHVLGDGPSLTRRLRVVDLGLNAVAAEGVPLIGAPTVMKRAGHKYDNGHALVLSGGIGRGGAARLAARAALRVGAGLVTLGCPPSALLENGCHLNAVMLRPIRDAGALAETLGDSRINALCLGPGLGTGSREAALVAIALASGRRAVLDADALTLIADDPHLRAALHERCVLTPHAGEFARLFPDLADRLTAEPAKYSKVDATRDAAMRVGCTILYKGRDTVIADRSMHVAIHAATGDRAAPWLATAGSGDVLAGLIAGLLARGYGPKQAAESAAWLHVEAARAFGPGLIAEDLPEMIPRVLAALEADG